VWNLWYSVTRYFKIYTGHLVMAEEWNQEGSWFAGNSDGVDNKCILNFGGEAS
jgi:hypothetical protein